MGIEKWQGFGHRKCQGPSGQEAASTRLQTTCASAASITSRGWSVFSHSGIRVTVLFPADAGMNRSKKQAHPMTVE